MQLARIIDIQGKIRWVDPSQLTNIDVVRSIGPFTNWTLGLNFNDQQVQVQWDAYVRFQKQVHPVQNTRQAEKFDVVMTQQANQLMLERRFLHASDFVHQVLSVVTLAQMRHHCWSKINSHVRHHMELVTAVIHLEHDIQQALPDDLQLVAALDARPGLLGNVLEAYLAAEPLSEHDKQQFTKYYLQQR